MPSLCFNVQSTALAYSFWTSTCLPSASTSNPPLLLTPFGLPPCIPLLQRPIRLSCLLLLDFHMPPLHFNIQSASLSRSFWTSTCLPSASTSNPLLFFVPFGLPHAFPPLQRPIHYSFSLLLDFLRVFLCFNVQSTSLSRSFWTSSVYSTTSTSIPPLFSSLFGLSHASPPLQHPIPACHTPQFLPLQIF